jgi:hypothetical protein
MDFTFRLSHGFTALFATPFASPEYHQFFALGYKMLPPPLLSVYRQYKEDTDAVASWLAATARAHGYPADLLTNAIPSQQRQGGRLKGKARKTQQKPEKKSAKFKYTVAIKDCVPLAEWIASRQPPVKVPASFASVINRVIAVRSNFADRIADHGI